MYSPRIEPLLAREAYLLRLQNLDTIDRGYPSYSSRPYYSPRRAYSPESKRYSYRVPRILYKSPRVDGNYDSPYSYRRSIEPITARPDLTRPSTSRMIELDRWLLEANDIKLRAAIRARERVSEFYYSPSSYRRYRSFSNPPRSSLKTYFIGSNRDYFNYIHETHIRSKLAERQSHRQRYRETTPERKVISNQITNLQEQSTIKKGHTQEASPTKSPTKSSDKFKKISGPSASKVESMPSKQSIQIDEDPLPEENL